MLHSILCYQRKALLYLRRNFQKSLLVPQPRPPSSPLLWRVSDFRNNTLRSFNRTRQNSFFDAWGEFFGFVQAIHIIFCTENSSIPNTKLFSDFFTSFWCPFRMVQSGPCGKFPGFFISFCPTFSALSHLLRFIGFTDQSRFLLVSNIPPPELVPTHPNNSSPLVGEVQKNLSRFSATRGGEVGAAPVVNIPLWCGVTGAGLSVTKAGLCTHILHYATKRDSKDKTISCVIMHK